MTPEDRQATGAAGRDAGQDAGPEPDAGRYVLRLYVTGMTPASTRAIANLRAICEQHLDGRYDLEVVDVYRHPERAVEAQLIAAPTLVKELPEPLRRMIGDMSDVHRVLLGLSLDPSAASEREERT